MLVVLVMAMQTGWGLTFAALLDSGFGILSSGF